MKRYFGVVIAFEKACTAVTNLSTLIRNQEIPFLMPNLNDIDGMLAVGSKYPHPLRNQAPTVHEVDSEL